MKPLLLKMSLSLYLEGGVADLLDEVLHGDVAGLEAHQELLALGSGHQLEVEGVTGEEVGDAGGQTRSRRGRGHLGSPGEAPLAPRHLVQDLLLCRGVGGDGGGEGRRAHHARSKGGALT